MLNNILNGSINTFFAGTKQNVSSLVQQMKNDKIDFNSLVSKLNSSPRFNDFNYASITTYGTLLREPIVDLFRDSAIRIKTLFNGANANGIVLDSMVAILGSEIEKVENDIANLQIFIDNYEFLAGKDDLYNANYLEKFDSFQNDYKYDGYNLDLVDRDSVNFSDNGGGFIDSRNGLFKIGNNLEFVNLIKNIESIKIKSNYDGYITSTDDFANVFNDNFFDSWSVTVKSPIILNANLAEFDEYIGYDYSGLSGAKTFVEVKFHSAIEIDTIRINPNFGVDMQLMQVVIFTSGHSYSSSNNVLDSYKNLLDSSKNLNSTLELNFERDTVSKVIFIFNKSSYVRSRKDSLTSELNSKALNSFVQERLNERRNRFSKIQDISYWYFLKNYSINGIKQNNIKDVEYYSCKFPEELSPYVKSVEEAFFGVSAFVKEDNPIFTSSPIFTQLLGSIAAATGYDTGLFVHSYFYEVDSLNRGSARLDSPGFIPGKSRLYINDPKYQFTNNNYGYGKSSEIIKKLLVDEIKDSYEYNFSIKSIEFSKTNSSSNKACFISKKIPTNGQILGIKAKVQAIDAKQISSETKYDLKNLVSYELSVSNIDFPILENDWIPLAFNDQNYINSEIVFFDITDLSSKLRFPPKNDSIIMYKDGFIINPSKYIYKQNEDKLFILDQSIFSVNSIFCVSYQINDSVYNPYELDFVKRNLYQESIKQYRNNSGLGQVFQKTNTQGTISLDYVPYINDSYILSAKYDKYFGTLFNSESNANYSPVKILLSDGSYAVNLTNYSRSAASVEFYGSSVQFIQNGKNIAFNQAISSPFTVLYEYIPYSLRFRFILRKNIAGIQVTGAADSVLLKMKTTYFDPFFDKLNYISKL